LKNYFAPVSLFEKITIFAISSHREEKGQTNMDSGKECPLPTEEEFLHRAGQKEERNLPPHPSLN
jgi:hypothetical protein